MPTPPDDPTWPSRAREMLSIMRSEIVNDVDNLDGTPVTGANMARIFGEIYATVDALAMTLDGLIARQSMQEQAAKHVARAAELGVPTHP